MKRLFSFSTSRVSHLFLQFSKQTLFGITVVSVPVGIWWYNAIQERKKVAEEVSTRIRLPFVSNADDYWIEKCRPGDILVFDRRWETCASGPWAALACIVARTFLCDNATGQFDHVGIIVPGYIHSKKDEFDSSNLLLLEATPQGIVTRSLKTRLERSQSRSVLLLQLNVPGERRDFVRNDDNNKNNNNNNDGGDKKLTSRDLSVQRTRDHLERELTKFRDKLVELGKRNSMEWKYSTIAIGGGIAYGLGLAEYFSSPISPSAFLVLLALQQCAAATPSVQPGEANLLVKPHDFLRNPRLDSSPNPVRLRPGWRFLPSVALRDIHSR